MKKKPIPAAELSDIAFLIEQLQIMEHSQDTARIAEIAAKYRIPHFRNH